MKTIVLAVVFAMFTAFSYAGECVCTCLCPNCGTKVECKCECPATAKIMVGGAIDSIPDQFKLPVVVKAEKVYASSPVVTSKVVTYYESAPTFFYSSEFDDEVIAGPIVVPFRASVAAARSRNLQARAGACAARAGAATANATMRYNSVPRSYSATVYSGSVYGGFSASGCASGRCGR